MYALDQDEKSKSAASGSPPPLKSMNGAATGPDSGLIDLKKLADGEIATSQTGLKAMKDEEAHAILASTSSASLSQIVLPIPGREVAHTEAPSAHAKSAEQPKKSRAGLAVGLLLVAGAGAAAGFFLWKRNQKKDPSVETQAAANSLPGSDAPGVTPDPTGSAPVVSAGAGTPVVEPTGVVAAAASDEAARAAAEAEAKAAAGKKDDDDKRKSKRDDDDKTSAKSGTAKTEVSKPETASVDKMVKGGATASAPEVKDETGATAKTTPSNDTQKEIEKLLGQGKDEVVDEGPKKTGLDKNEIKTGMTKMKGPVQSCADQHNAVGVVKVALTIASSGAPTASKVLGDFATHAVAGCVKDALMKASFPSWSGASMTVNFSYSVD